MPTSVTLIVTLTASVPPLPSLTLTATEYLDFSSKFSAAFVCIWPALLVTMMSNESASTPSKNVGQDIAVGGRGRRQDCRRRCWAVCSRLR